MTEQRRIIVQVLSDSKDHPDVEAVHRRASKIDKRIGIATVYRTIACLPKIIFLRNMNLKDLVQDMKQ